MYLFIIIFIIFIVGIFFFSQSKKVYTYIQSHPFALNSEEAVIFEEENAKVEYQKAGENVTLLNAKVQLTNQRIIVHKKVKDIYYPEVISYFNESASAGDFTSEEFKAKFANRPVYTMYIIPKKNVTKQQKDGKAVLNIKADVLKDSAVSKFVKDLQPEIVIYTNSADKYIEGLQATK